MRLVSNFGPKYSWIVDSIVDLHTVAVKHTDAL